MKKTFLFGIAVFMSAVVFAQKPVWGIKGGINLAIWNSENKTLNDRLDPRTGIHLGIISHNHITHKIAVQPELQYSSQGTKNNDGTHKYDYRMSYINLPVMFQYMFDNGFALRQGLMLDCWWLLKMCMKMEQAKIRKMITKPPMLD
jgi:hypothetical protein